MAENSSSSHFPLHFSDLAARVGGERDRICEALYKRNVHAVKKKISIFLYVPFRVFPMVLFPPPLFFFSFLAFTEKTFFFLRSLNFFMHALHEGKIA